MSILTSFGKDEKNSSCSTIATDQMHDTHISKLTFKKIRQPQYDSRLQWLVHREKLSFRGRELRKTDYLLRGKGWS